MDVEALIAQACDEAGTDDFGDGAWREGLDQLTAALDAEARLNDTGRAVVPGELTGYLRDRLNVVAATKTAPEVTAADVVPPIVIVGQGRTGTTILHDLLALDPATRVPMTWEVDHPVPAPETATFDTDPRIAARRRDARDGRPRPPRVPGDAPDGRPPARRSACASPARTSAR